MNLVFKFRDIGAPTGRDSDQSKEREKKETRRRRHDVGSKSDNEKPLMASGSYISAQVPYSYSLLFVDRDEKTREDERRKSLKTRTGAPFAAPIMIF